MAGLAGSLSAGFTHPLYIVMTLAAIVGLAGLGLEETCVELVADPMAASNRHEIEAEGLTGRIRYCVEGYASKENPRTSLLTVYSLLRYLTNRNAAIVI